MDDNECNKQLRATLHGVFGLENSDSLHDEDLSVFDGEEDDYGEDDVEEEKGPMYDDSYIEEQYTAGPIVGMCFHYVQTTFTFYKEHSRLNGFGVVKKSAKKLAGQLKYVTFGCDKCRKTTTKNQSKRVYCKARVNYQVMNDSSCVATKVILEHNHELKPALSHFFPCHRELSRTVKRSLVAYDIAGLRSSKSIRLLEVEAGGPERMSDAAALHGFFVNMQSKDNFFYSIDADNTGRIQNAVWVHTHCRVAYRDFSDVICFDTTYLMDQWSMPFASFIGVNHHNQSILLGCALLTSEDIKTYAFIFRTWLMTMGEISLTAILIDQYESIKAAIREVLPNTIHRRRDLKNVLKACFKTYMAWKDDMVVPNIPDLDFDTDSTIVRNSREVHLRERPRSTETNFCINTHAAEMLRDGDLDTMMYMMRDKAVKVGVAAADGAVKVLKLLTICEYVILARRIPFNQIVVYFIAWD
ncbi:hypothetical protein FXO38_29489 [Capsicum annuum]|nr:hypothetical protein FXO38_29489 [Capsicum annuum]